MKTLILLFREFMKGVAAAAQTVRSLSKKEILYNEIVATIDTLQLQDKRTSQKIEHDIIQFQSKYGMPSICPQTKELWIRYINKNDERAKELHKKLCT